MYLSPLTNVSKALRSRKLGKWSVFISSSSSTIKCIIFMAFNSLVRWSCTRYQSLHSAHTLQPVSCSCQKIPELIRWTWALIAVESADVLCKMTLFISYQPMLHQIMWVIPLVGNGLFVVKFTSNLIRITIFINGTSNN